MNYKCLENKKTFASFPKITHAFFSDVGNICRTIFIKTGLGSSVK